MGGVSGPRRQVGLVLIGAVSKGAFEAGALEVVASRNIAVRRIVATSSGSLNGTVYAAAVRARRELPAMAELVEIWQEQASLLRVIHLRPWDIVRGRGISDQKKLRALLRRHVRPCTIPDPAPIEMNVVVAPINGCEARVDGVPTTTYSHTLRFRNEAFDHAASLERVFDAAVASAALPVLYVPVELPGLGLCSDGGFVNLTPVLSAFGDDGGASLDAVLVVAPTPSLAPEPRRMYRWLHMVARQIDMIFAEWLYQDLRRARQDNDILARLDATAARGRWPPEVIARVRAALDFPMAQPTPVVSIRPTARLPGSVFSGFADAGIRKEYLALGRERAIEVLDELGWT